MTPLTFVIIALIVAWLGDGLAEIITWINGYAGWDIPLINSWCTLNIISDG